ncbi:DEAD/DEAH box helicase [Amycolatopsis sp. MEPSY49]|uniref:DEAD/DEAH box helicase n=1 Tax=Amycolatopsis sp. MEPSY49 TaxID=3151600 RepID=UPI003EF352D5
MRNEIEAGRILRFWRSIEILSPQKAPKPTELGARNSGEWVLDLSPGAVCPWDERHPIHKKPLRPGLTRQYTVYGGLFDLAGVQSVLERHFGNDGKYVDQPLRGEAASFAFTLDARGALIENSGTLSACAWAIGRTTKVDPETPDWLEGFKQEERDFATALNALTSSTALKSRAASVARAAVHTLASKAKSAAVEAGTEGAKSTGAAVTTAAAATVGAVAGPIVGGVAGAVAGKFAEALLTPKKQNSPGTSEKDEKDEGVEAPESSAPRFVITSRALHWFAEELGTELGIKDLLGTGGIRIKTSVVRARDAAEPVEQNFLNSYLMDDLARVAGAVESGKTGIALAEYLRADRTIPAGDRIDVRSDTAAVTRGVEPARIPPGRWPQDPARSLVVSQQFAVDQVIGDLYPRGGVFAVNGPPGTGKTTLLRDVLAAIVVQRAEALSTLHHPVDGFPGPPRKVALTDRYTATVRAPRADLTGFEILLATAGNDAAENVTAEIPGIGAVRGGEEAALAADYFTELATHVLGAEAWGLVAAKLGKKSHCAAFVKSFWWGDSRPSPSTDHQDQTEPEQIKGMRALLDAAAREPLDAAGWARSVAQFKTALAKVRKLADERQLIAEAVTRLARERAALESADRNLSEAQKHWRRTHQYVPAVAARLHRARGAFAEADREYELHLRRKPGFWEQLLSLFRRLTDWRQRDNELARARELARRELRESEFHQANLDAELNRLAGQCRHHEQRRLEEHRKVTATTEIVDSARARWPGVLPEADSFRDPDHFQLWTPWADSEFTRARNDVFLEALRLHKAFVLGSEARLRDNLNTVMTALRDRLTIATDVLLAAWQSLFLVVPIISTTFASLPRLFGQFGADTFGWLFVDEAGQAAPQQVVGGIWRARRALLVGDPRQLEPIVSLPQATQDALSRHLRVDRRWSPGRASAQQIADRLARFGTALPQDDDGPPLWVGSPLRVHRRCDRPMFEISNRIAYGGTVMVYGTGDRGPYPGSNQWIDVVSGESEDKWIPEEGLVLVRLLRDLLADGVPLNDVRIISPFRKVVQGSQRVVGSQFGWDFAKENIGTVHTVQGKEADVVILVLGGGPGKQRARAWAAEKPNLLNVAVSRAKRRLIVIGNRADWGREQYFDVLRATLPRTLPVREQLPGA